MKQLGRRRREAGKGSAVAAAAAAAAAKPAAAAAAAAATTAAAAAATATPVRNLKGLAVSFRCCWDAQHGAPRAADVVLQGFSTPKP